MGTKLNPGQFDCYANAAPDEPMFVLLGRDKHAPTLVKLWAQMRRDDGESAEKVQEAEDCAVAMAVFRKNRKSRGETPPAAALCQKCGQAMEWHATSPFIGARCEWRCLRTHAGEEGQTSGAPPAAAPEPWTPADEQFSAHDAPSEPIEPHVVPLDDPNVPVSLVHLSKYDALLASLRSLEQAWRREPEVFSRPQPVQWQCADELATALAQAEGKP